MADTTKDVPFLRLCVWCSVPHSLGVKCSCGSINVQRDDDFYICGDCDRLFKLDNMTPITTGICADAEAKLLAPEPPMRSPVLRRDTNAITAAVMVGGATAIVAILIYLMVEAIR